MNPAAFNASASATEALIWDERASAGEDRIRCVQGDVGLSPGTFEGEGTAWVMSAGLWLVSGLPRGLQRQRWDRGQRHTGRTAQTKSLLPDCDFLLLFCYVLRVYTIIQPPERWNTFNPPWQNCKNAWGITEKNKQKNSFVHFRRSFKMVCGFILKKATSFCVKQLNSNTLQCFRLHLKLAHAAF